MIPLRRSRQLLRPLICACWVLACSKGEASFSDGEVAQPTGELERAIAANPTLRDAVKSIDSGHPWQATVAVTPLLKQTPRNHAAVLVAARAAAAWDGWSEVEKLLSGESWLDSSFAGEGRELLARALLVSNSAAAAVQNAEAALSRSPGAAATAARQVYLARALDRDSKPDSAAAMYTAASAGLPAIADWLALRAAGAESDADARARAYARVRGPVAKARIPWTEAQARERFGDPAGAADRYAALGARAAALRLRFAGAAAGAEQGRMKDSLVAFLRGASRDDARQIVQVLDGASTTLSIGDELAIARALAPIGPVARAVQGFDKAARAGALTPDDRLQYALVLSRVNRSREAIAQLDSVREPAGVTAQAAYQRARIIMTATGSAAAVPALRSVADRFAADTSAASAALYLLADLLTDAGSDDSAISTYRELYRRYPKGARADDARFRAAILDFAHGRTRQAAMAFDSIVVGFPTSNELSASRYWSGRAWTAVGDARKASANWQSVIADQPMSYYGIASARRLKRAAWAPAAATAKPVAFPAVESAFARITSLKRLGMDAEARFELDALEDGAVSTKELMLATATAFHEHGETPRAIRLANKLIEQGERNARVYQLAFPIVDRDALERQSAIQKLDPALVAGLIKQESGFDPVAVSVAGARGLMQVLPSVGAEIARAMRYPIWSPSLLNDPDVNLQLGTAHLAAATKEYSDVTRVLAAYNAGASRVDRWQKKTGPDDAELFAEQIPFVETRDYVRVVQRNAQMYRVLYGMK